MELRPSGLVFVVSGPSGVGKTTLCREMVRRFPNLRFSISHTTRPLRRGDQEGRDYYFVSEETFQRMIEEGEFWEWATIYGYRYGTSRKKLQEMLDQGHDVILDIDGQGARQLRAQKIPAVYIFILPPSMEELRRRLSQRHTEGPEGLQERLGKALAEMEEARQYDYFIINDDLQIAQGKLEAILRAEPCRRERMIGFLDSFLQRGMGRP
jgi:guanylate kinase